MCIGYGLRFGYAIAALVSVGTTAQAADWQVSEASSPLTGAVTVSATLDSTQPLANMLGLAQPATLVIRCSGRDLATYVIWPQVLSVFDTKPVLLGAGSPETMVDWKVDNGEIAVNFWTISSEGIAAGKFTTGGALKILRKLEGAHRLVVRMTGRITQDAVFDLGEVAPVIARAEQTCGVAGER